MKLQKLVETFRCWHSSVTLRATDNHLKISATTELEAHDIDRDI